VLFLRVPSLHCLQTTLNLIFDKAIETRMDRRCTLLALGGAHWGHDGIRGGRCTCGGWTSFRSPPRSCHRSASPLPSHKAQGTSHTAEDAAVLPCQVTSHKSVAPACGDPSVGARQVSDTASQTYPIYAPAVVQRR